jgi:polar amino acid transport system substrate-binding protein
MWSSALFAQNLTVSTVDRVPFSMNIDGQETGFSIDLLGAIAQDLNLELTIERQESFGEMLDKVATGQAEIAAANISITASREEIFDFSHPIFQSGLQIMVQKNNNSLGILGVLWSQDLLILIVIAFAVLFGAGMLMWRFERGAQTYFDLSAKDAGFPAFWWALNLVVNGGFEERAPRTPAGRVFGTFLVIASLFFVSIFVANITALMTVKAIEGSVNSINDLYGQTVGTVAGSTAADYLDAREIEYRSFASPTEMLESFTNENLDAVVFDFPILAYFANGEGRDIAEMIGNPFKPENYGFILPSGSPLVEEVNQSLLRLRENGTVNDLREKWFGKN